MSAQALYLKWRSQTFEEVIGQEHVTRTLHNALERGRMAHAYLFCGPRGTGKTSTARILAKAVNCESESGDKPCNRCRICMAVNDGSLMDLIEIDAASNTGVDDVRRLRDAVAFRPNQARFKVYVIDEVHMLSNAAFNALLKTLEEPPPHVVFVLATTEPQKIPATIISRCQRFDFRFVPTSAIAEHVLKIADGEGMKIDRAAADLIAAHAGGAVRDAVTLLDQLTAYGQDGITLEHVRSILGVGSVTLVGDFVDALVQRDLTAGLRIIDTLVDQGTQLRQFNVELLEYLRGALLFKAGGDLRLLGLSPDARRRLGEQAALMDLQDMVRVIRLFSEAAQGLKGSLQPQLPLELAFVEATTGPTAPAAAAEATSVRREAVPRPPQVSEAPKSEGTMGRAAASPSQTEKPPAPRERASEGGSAASQAQPAPLASELDQDASSDGVMETIRRHWSDILQAVRPMNKDTEAFLRSAQPVAMDGETIILGFKHEFHKARFESQGCGAVASQAISQVVGRRILVRCQLGQKAPARRAMQTPSGQGEEGSREVTTARAAPAKAERGDSRSAETSPPVQKGSVEDDPLVKAAMSQFGARVARVTTNDQAPDAPPEDPPLPEEPPPLY